MKTLPFANILKERLAPFSSFKYTPEYRSFKNLYEVKEVDIYITGRVGCGKSHLLKAIFQASFKTLTYNSDDLDKLSIY